MQESPIELLVTPSCPHCGAMKKILERLQQQGRIHQYEVIDISVHPEIAAKYGVREVPWLRMGLFEFSGSYTARELEPWLPDNKNASLAGYFSHLLESGSLAQVTDRIRREPDSLAPLIALMAEPETPIAVQLGIGAVMESLAGSDTLRQQGQTLCRLARNKEARIRADACHYLGLTGDKAVLPVLQSCLNDENADVREIAGDSIQAINNA